MIYPTGFRFSSESIAGENLFWVTPVKSRGHVESSSKQIHGTIPSMPASVAKSSKTWTKLSLTFEHKM